MLTWQEDRWVIGRGEEFSGHSRCLKGHSRRGKKTQISWRLVVIHTRSYRISPKRHIFLFMGQKKKQFIDGQTRQETTGRKIIILSTVRS